MVNGPCDGIMHRFPVWARIDLDVLFKDGEEKQVYESISANEPSGGGAFRCL